MSKWMCALTIGALGSLATAQTLYGVSRDDNMLRTIDQSDGSTLNSVAMVDNGGRSPTGMNGLAADPTSGLLYGLFKFGGGPRFLGTVDPGTGDVATIGATSDSFAGIAFDNAGQLYGVTGDGGSTPETLFTIDKSDASSAFLLGLGNGEDGETIGFNNDNGLMYHASGIDVSEKVWEEIDLSIPAVVDSTIIAVDPPEEILAMTYAGGGNFFMADRISGGGDSGFFTINTDGVAVQLGAMGFTAKGLALVPPIPAPGTLFVLGAGAALATRRRR